ncbi:atpase associated with various cellular activities aaa 3 [Methylobacterium sp. GXF4]|nr:atpase associated with various cellular activities aaa 3 [Methylobacterium sp. GXF4]
MKLNTFADRFVGYYNAGNCMTLRSKPGRGKTTVIESAPAIIGAALGKRMGYSYISCPTLTPADTVGYLIPSKDAKGNAASFFTRPFWWYTSEGLPLEDYDGGVLFLDEEDKADPDIKKIIGEMALTGRCGPHTLPPGWVVWMAGNLRSDRSGSTRDLDHLINRRCEIKIEDDLESWKAWAMAVGMPPLALAFAESNWHIITADAPEVQGPWPTPRSFVMCINHLMQFAEKTGEHAGKLPHDNAAQQDAQGYIGSAAAAQLMSFIRLEYELPSLADILADPLGTPVPVRADAQMLVAYSLAARVDVGNIGQMVAYLDRFPQEFSVLFADAACNRDRNILNTSAMDGWCQRNGTLMVTISKLRAKR